ncbi:uncharacterized protein A4U43_C09F14020 [Asparagus officinalis]|uniref:Uncharacterized protein n=1 Tax=Asparagus officinalis TaxID=4686 RepID=A0A5P1E7I4_ASPOF|nr:uncharacterized protein A4U43_C09F14020 [Asparagus officinalis]
MEICYVLLKFKVFPFRRFFIGVLNVDVGERSRLAWLGIKADPLHQSDNLLKAYNRNSDTTADRSSDWFIFKSAIISGLGLLGIKQGNGDI